MSASVRITGLRELMEHLTNAPDDLRRDGMAIVREAAAGAKADIIASYPEGATGNLRAQVTVDFPSSDVLVARVQSKAPHAHLYEFGTTERHTASGSNRGRMPKAPVTPDVAQRWRAMMFEKLVDLVRSKGFTVAIE